VDYTTPTLDDFANAVWEAPLEPETRGVSANAKEALRQHCLSLLLPVLLPVLEERVPVWWKVLSVLHEKSPSDFSSFELSSRELARVAGVSTNSTPGAIDYLHELKLLEVKKGLWAEDPKQAVRPKYRLTPLEELKRSGATTAPSKEGKG
jgi:hypothetical protein